MDSPEASSFKCTHSHCPYGPDGSKSFKKELFLHNHLKNIHEERAFKCPGCKEKFAFEWQLKYHQKYCGAELRCEICNKVYTKPMSLWMHCKRRLHSPPADQQFKLRKNQEVKTALCVFVPIFIDSSSSSSRLSLPGTRPIFPKPTEAVSSLPDVRPVNGLQSSKSVKSHSTRKSSTAKPMPVTNRRSTECQTVRKKNRSSLKQDLKSIETQTLHSSFDAQSNRLKPESTQVNINTKCSSFTQTLFDEAEQGDLIVRDAFLSTSEMSHSEQQQPMPIDFAANLDAFENYNTTETQTNLTHFGSEDIGIMAGDGDDFRLSDLGLIDIETQTIWNYDRTTQTESDPSNLDPYWLMNII